MTDNVFFFILIVVVGSVFVSIYFYDKVATRNKYWFTAKHLAFTTVGSLLLVFYLFIQQLNTDQLTHLRDSVEVRNQVVDIYLFYKGKGDKNMKLDNGRILSLPNKMKEVLHIGDSIYKNRGDDYYIIVNKKTSQRTTVYIDE